MTMRKQFAGARIKNEETGEFSAVFSTLKTIDSDGDVTLPGAFTDGAEVVISAYNHQSWGGALPVGKGTIREDGDEAIVEGQFFLDTTAGRDTFRTVKQLGDLGEWSYSLHNVVAKSGEWDGQQANILSSIDVHEVSPVLRGAGVNTRTLATKGEGMKLSEHIDTVVTAVDALTTRVADVKTLRADQGKTISPETLAALTPLVEALEQAKALTDDDESTATKTDDDSSDHLTADEAAELLSIAHNLREETR